MFSASLLSRCLIAADTIVLRLTRPEGFFFRAGQYTVLSLPDVRTDGIDREFSIATAPHEDVIELAMRVRDSSFKQSCAEMPLGSTVELSHPQGDMTLIGDGSKQIWIAGGIGVVPFRGMLRDLVHRGKMRDVTLFFSDRSPAYAPFLNELREIEQQHPQFKLIVTFTQSAGLKNGKGGRGRISEQTILAHILQIPDKQYSVVGTRPFVASMRGMLTQLGVPESQIRSERFCGYTTNNSKHDTKTSTKDSEQVSGTHRIT